MMGMGSDVGVLFAFEPMFNNEGAVGNRTAHILDRGAKRQHNPLMSQGIEVSAKRALSTVEQPVGQVFNGQQTSLLEGFDAHALHSMPTQSRNAFIFSDLEVLRACIESKGHGGLFPLDRGVLDGVSTETT